MSAVDLQRNVKPILHPGEYVFCLVTDYQSIPFNQILFYFKEEEGYTIVLLKNIADGLRLDYTYIAAWITLSITTSLEMVGFTAVFSTALAKAGIGCNVVAAHQHDHIFVNYLDGTRAMVVLSALKA